MDSEFISQVIALVKGHAWVPLAALVIGWAVRQLKSDAPLPFYVAPKWRPLIALALGVVSGILEALIRGTKPADAIVGGVISAALAVFTHQTVVEGIRGGKEFPFSSIGRSRRGPDVTMVGIVFLVLLVTGCSSLGHAKDPTVDQYIGDACSLLAAQNRPALEAEAQKRGISIQQVIDVFTTACQSRMRAALPAAKSEGFAAVTGDAGAP